MPAACTGVIKAQYFRMKKQAGKVLKKPLAGRGGIFLPAMTFPAVNGIADNWMALFRQVHPNLMRPPGF